MDIENIYNLFIKSTGISIDSRLVKLDNIFFGIKGKNFDGNKFAIQAIENGASIAIVDNKDIKVNDKILYVKNSLKCLQLLANYHREKIKIPIIAITGTNGKTTTKELINIILSTQYKVGHTLGNFNNHIGVPLTLLSFTSDMSFGIVEMGANHKNEINELCEIAKPNFGIITNIGKAHLEGFGTEEILINTKKELYDYLYKTKGTVFINSDNKLLNKICNAKTISYSTTIGSDIRANIIDLSPFIKFNWNNEITQTKIIGRYNFENILAAICVGNYFGIEKRNIISALQNFIPDNNRSQIINTETNTVLLDAYNANPSSMKHAIDNFNEIITEKEKVFFLGDMFELGKNSKKEHLIILEDLKKLEINNVFLIGYNFYNLSKQYNFIFFMNTSKFISYIKEHKFANKYILIKASRGIKLERVLEYI